MVPPGPPTILSAFLSVTPLEPVLVFHNSDDAIYFQSRCHQGRILPDQRSNWVFLPLPEGLLRVRKARGGDIAFDFDSNGYARRFNDSIKGMGLIYNNTPQNPRFDRVVYVGRK